MPQMQIDPAQIPALIEQNKAQRDALEKVVELKKECIAHLTMGLELLGENSIKDALEQFFKVQLIEYRLQTEGLQERLNQTVDILKQLDSPIMSASSMLPPKRFKPPTM